MVGDGLALLTGWPFGQLAAGDYPAHSVLGRAQQTRMDFRRACEALSLRRALPPGAKSGFERTHDFAHEGVLTSTRGVIGRSTLFTGLAVRTSLFSRISGHSAAVYRGVVGFFQECRAARDGVVEPLFSLQKEHIS